MLRKVLYIDLTRQESWIEERQELFESWMGGTGVGIRLLQEECPPGTDPLSPEAPIILAIGPFNSKEEAESALSYLSCRLTRLLIQLRKASQHVTSRVYGFVPVQEWAKQWTDSDLYAKYRLTDEEIAFVEKVVRPMELGIDE